MSDDKSDLTSEMTDRNCNTLGVIGAGQLGRMMGLEGTPLNRSFCFLGDAESGQPAAVIGPVLDRSNQATLAIFQKKVDVITYESENVNADWLEKLAEDTPIYPGLRALRSSQHRWREKDMFKSLGIETAPYVKVTSLEELTAAAETLGLPLVVKTATDGYDGKGQARVHTLEDVPLAWQALSGSDAKAVELIAEGFVQFSRELSVIAVRSVDGDIQYYPMTENFHSEGILRVSRMVPGSLSEETRQTAMSYVQKLLEYLDYVGVIALELFDTEQGLLANEMAPRVHNTGHWTQLGAVTSQFENHVRAVAGLPLGDTQALQPYAAMINLIGRLPNPEKILQMAGTSLHLYGKSARPGRKLGHINLIAGTQDELESKISLIQQEL